MIKSYKLLYILLVLTIVLGVLPAKNHARSYFRDAGYNNLKIEKLISTGKLEDAKKLVQLILNNHPDDLNARVHLGNIYSKQYKLDAAKNEFLHVLSLDSENAYAHNGLGTVYYRKTTSSDSEVRKKIPQYLEAALDEFTAAISIKPGYYQAYNNAGTIYFKTGRINEAEKYFKKAIELNPSYSEAIENYGRVLFSQNNIDDAISYYSNAIQLNEKNSSAYFYLGEAYIAKGQYSKAIKQFQTSLFLFPNSSPVHDMLGKAYELIGNESAAIAEYKKASLIKPDYTSPYLRLADIYTNRGEYEFAIAELNNAISINPDFIEAKFRVAEIALRVGKVEQALHYYESLLNHPEYHIEALKGMSAAYFVKAQQVGKNYYKDNLVNLENQLRQAVINNPDNTELNLALLKVSRINHKDSQSEYYLRRITTASGMSSTDHVIKGEAFLAYKYYDKAESEFLQAVNKARSTEDILNLAEVMLINKSYSTARAAVSRVLSNESANTRAVRLVERINENEKLAVAKFELAESFYKKRKRVAAIHLYKDALALNPFLKEAQLKLAKTFEKEKYYYNAVEHYSAYVSLVDSGKDAEKYQKKIDKLIRKINKLEEKNIAIKEFTKL